MKKVHLVATVRSLVINKEVINNAKQASDLNHSDLNYFILATNAEWHNLQFIIDHKHLPVLTTIKDNFENFSTLYNFAGSIFPAGLPKSLSKMSWDQKKFLTLIGAETTAACLHIIPRLYGKVPSVSDHNLPNVKQVIEYNSLAIAEAAAMALDKNEIIVIHEFNAYFADVVACFPHLDIEGVYRSYLPTTGVKTVDEFIANVTTKEWVQRTTVHCHALKQQLAATPGHSEMASWRTPVKAHMIPSWFWTSFEHEELIQIEKSTSQADFSENMQEAIQIALHEQVLHLKHIIKYKHIPLISALSVVSLEKFQDLLYHDTIKTFPNGLPENLGDLNWQQIKFLLLIGAEKTAVFTNVIPQLYGIQQVKFETNLNNERQIADFKTLHIAQQIADEIKAKNIMILHHSISYFADVKNCFPDLYLDQLKDTIVGTGITHYKEMLANNYWKLRPEVNCTALNNSLTSADLSNNFQLLVNKPAPDSIPIGVTLAAGLAVAYCFIYAGFNIFRACTKHRNAQRRDSYHDYQSASRVVKKNESSTTAAPISAAELNPESFDRAEFPKLHMLFMRHFKVCNARIVDAKNALALLENNPLLQFKKGRKTHLFIDYFNAIVEYENKALGLSAMTASLTEYSASHFVTLRQARLDLNTLQEELQKLSEQLHNTKEYYKLGKHSLLADRSAHGVVAQAVNHSGRRLARAPM
jgi:hypothetical protein